jgi:Ca-activated chloride channel homolog
MMRAKVSKSGRSQLVQLQEGDYAMATLNLIGFCITDFNISGWKVLIPEQRPLTAPVLDGDNVYLTTLDGGLYSFNQKDGQPIFNVASNMTKMDAGDGFATVKNESQMDQTGANLLHGSVPGVRLKQDFRPLVYEDRLYVCIDEFVQCSSPITEAIVWKTKVAQRNEQVVEHLVTPPALVNSKVFVGTACGSIVCLSTESGEVLWRAKLGEPVLFQPVIADGRIFVASSRGSLFCLDTRYSKDDGWLMFGGGAVHKRGSCSADPMVRPSVSLRGQLRL